MALGDAGTDTTTITSQLSANGSVGTAGQILSSRGADLSPQWIPPTFITRSTAVTTSGAASYDFLSIPANVKRIFILFNAVSTNGTANYLLQIGTSSGIETTGYTGAGSRVGASAVATSAFTNGFGFNNNTAAEINSGVAVLNNISGNVWVLTSVLASSAANQQTLETAGNKTLASTLDRLRLTTVGGTDLFDGGTLNITWEF